MTLLFKLSGFLLIIITTTALGFLKSNELASRHKKLISIHKSISVLKEQIRLGGGEIDRLIDLSFNTNPKNYKHLEKDDIKILEDFFSDIGMSDTKSEYSRCELYMNLLSTKIEDANKKYRELNRLYKSIGLFSGIFICIFLI